MVHKDQNPFEFLKPLKCARLLILSVCAWATITSAPEPPEQVAPASPPAAQSGNRKLETHGQTEILQHRNRRYQLHSADVLSRHQFLDREQFLFQKCSG